MNRNSNKHVCKNPKCITTTEKYVEQKFVKVSNKEDLFKCVYCDFEQTLN